MKQGWFKWLLLLGVLLSATCNSNADARVYFVNIVGGVRQYLYQQDGTKVTTPFVAQLCINTNERIADVGWVAISQPVPIKNGFFVGGIVTIPGIQRGQSILLKVRAWNGGLFSTYEEAYNTGGVTGESQPGYVTLDLFPSNPDAPIELVGFFPFPFTCDPYRVAKVVSAITTQEGQTTPVSFPFTSRDEEICPYAIDATYINDSSQHYATNIPGNLPGLTLGTIRGVWDSDHKLEGRPFTYIPSQNFYGTDLVYFEKCWYCADFSSLDAISVTIEPSAARNKPTLILSPSQKPALLGLNARKYRIDRSTDLKTWEPAGTVTGNYSTVDLSSFVTAGVSAQFLRATDVTLP